MAAPLPFFDARSDGLIPPPFSAPDWAAVYHLQTLHRKMEPFVNNTPYSKYANYGGPWIENRWIDAFWDRINHPESLAQTFRGYLPLLLPWNDIWLNNRYRYPKAFVRTLLQMLQSNRTYITVSQNDQGIVGKAEFALPTNIFVLSAGGYGHAPIPLLAREHFSKSDRKNREHRICFIGRSETAPHGLRTRTLAAVTRHFPENERFIAASVARYDERLGRCVFALAPRGYGRTSFRLAETIAVGTLPVYIYSDIAWIPYRTLYDQFGFAASSSELDDVLRRIRHMGDEEIRLRQAKLAEFAHMWTYNETLSQIGLFLQGRGLLEKVGLPHSIRDAG